MTAPAIARRWRERSWSSMPGRSESPAVRRAATAERVVPLRRRAPLAALLATAIVLHAGLAPHLAISGIAPDVLLVAVVTVAVGQGARAGAAFGFAAGLGADMFLATPLGTSALAYTFLGHVLGGSAHSRSANSRPSAPWRAELRRSLVVAFVGVATGRLAVAVVASTLGGLPFPGWGGLVRLAGVAALSAPLGPPTAALLRRLGRPSGLRW